jgi:hypothetical protein
VETAVAACVEAFGTHDAEDCLFLWPPDGERVFLDAQRRQAEAFRHTKIFRFDPGAKPKSF